MAESAIYKIDGVRIIAASAQRAFADGNGDQIDTTYLKNTSASKWNETYEAVTANSGDWDKVSDKLDTTAFNDWSAGKDFVEYSAGTNIDITNHVVSGKNWTTEINAASSNAVDVVNGKFEGTNDGLTAYNGSSFAIPDAYSAGQNINITDFVVSGKDWTNDITATADAASANAVTTVEGKFTRNTADKITAYNGSAFANDTYTGGTGIEVTNANVINVTANYVTSADASLNDKMLVLHNNAWMEMPEMGGFLTATPAGTDNHPDVSTPSTKIIYLVKDSSVTGDDKYNEWIYTSADASTTAWEKIGDTSIDLHDYATTSWVTNNYSAASDLTTEFGKYVQTANTANWDVTAYSGKDGISVASHEIGLSSDYVTAIQQVSGKLTKSDFDTWSAGKDFVEYTAGANIDITNHVVSGKDWTNYITTTASQASANAVTTVEDKFGLTQGGEISSYNNSAIAQPDVSNFVTSSDLETTLENYQTTADMSAYLTTATYSTDSASWQSVYDTVSTNSGNWSAAYTVINVPNLNDITDLASNQNP